MGGEGYLAGHDHEPPYPRRPRRLRAARRASRRWTSRPRSSGKAVRDTVPAGPAKDALSGVWLGHALHPLLTDLPIGSYTSAVLLDWLGGRDAERAADRLIGLGLLFTLPTAATGMTEWADSEVGDPAVRRVGLVHAALNVGATALFGASLAARRGGARGTGRLLALAGAGLLGASRPSRRPPQLRGGRRASTRPRSRSPPRTGPPRCATTSCPRVSRASPRSAASACSSPAIRVLSTRSPTAARTAAGRSTRASSTTAASPARGTSPSSSSKTAASCRARRRTRSRAGTPACATASSSSVRTPAPRSPPPGSDPFRIPRR